MNEQLFNALEISLVAIENGETLDSALSRVPHLQAELRPLLETSYHARTLAESPIPADAQRLGRARLLQRAAEMREARRVQKRTWLFNLRPLAVTLALLILFFVSGNRLVHASSASLPGDGLYSIKRTWEDARLLLTFNDVARESLALEYESERLEEVNELLVEGREEPVTITGYVTVQENNLWMVAGVPVRLSETTSLSDVAIPLGAGVQVTGQTDAQGYLIANSITVLPPGAIIPPGDDDEDDDSESENEISTVTPSPMIIGTAMPAGAATETETESSNQNSNGNEDDDKAGNDNDDSDND